MKTFTFFIIALFLGITASAQTPQSFRYQAVARNNSGVVLANQSVSFRISILSGSVSGTITYRETHTGLTTNTFGLVELEIGKGTPVNGTFSSIEWGSNSYFVQVEMDPAGGTSYQELSTSQLLSVPYALFAKDVQNGTKPGGITGDVQFNNSGVFGGDANLLWDNANKRLGIGTNTPLYPLHVKTGEANSIWGESASPSGLGVFGLATSATGNSYGVAGSSYSSSGIGVIGEVTSVSGVTFGVYGLSHSPDGFGVFGRSESPTGAAFGVFGSSKSTSGTGVYGFNEAATGTTIGVRGAVVSPGGYSGYFEGGKFSVNSQAEIHDTLSMSNNVISNVANPVNAQDAATKAYVDALFGQLIRIGVISVDIDGNFYQTVKIGSQVWMAENLKTTKYNDGTAIPLVTDAMVWANLTSPGFCWYNNDQTTYAETYGALYNWYTVNTGKLCPTGWHVPSDAEWTTLTTFLGGESVAGGKMKEAGTTHWQTPNTGATNESGFSALPGGYRHGSGPFRYVGDYGYWWSSTESSTSDAWTRGLVYDGSGVGRYYGGKEYGLSVRCVRD